MILKNHNSVEVMRAGQRRSLRKRSSAHDTALLKTNPISGRLDDGPSVKTSQLEFLQLMEMPNNYPEDKLQLQILDSESYQHAYQKNLIPYQKPKGSNLFCTTIQLLLKVLCYLAGYYLDWVLNQTIKEKRFLTKLRSSLASEYSDLLHRKNFRCYNILIYTLVIPIFCGYFIAKLFFRGLLIHYCLMKYDGEQNFLVVLCFLYVGLDIFIQIVTRFWNNYYQIKLSDPVNYQQFDE